MKPTTLLIPVLLLASQSLAATPERIAMERRSVTKVAPAADGLKLRLAAEVEKVLNAGRLAPFRTLYGEGGLRYHWREPWQMIYTLSLALPHLRPEVQARVKRYMKEEIAARPPWEGKLIGPQGAKRQPDDLPERVFAEMPKGDQERTAFAPYALWVYADRSGDWQTIRDNWQAIQKNFAMRAGGRPNYETVSGAIGLYRLARGTGDAAVAEASLKTAAGAIEACRSFEAARASAHRAYTGREQWNRETAGVLYAFLNLTPEAARLIADTPRTKQAAEEYAAAGRKIWPLWWMAQAPVGDWGYYGEGCCAGPEQRAMLFNYEAWVVRVPPERLNLWTDVPDALIGDCTFIQNLITAIEATGEDRWDAQ